MSDGELYLQLLNSNFTIVPMLEEKELRLFREEMPEENKFKSFFCYIDTILQLKDNDDIHLGVIFNGFLSFLIPGSKVFNIVKDFCDASNISERMFTHLILFMINYLDWEIVTLGHMKKIMNLAEQIMINGDFLAFAISYSDDGYKTIIISEEKIDEKNIRLIDIKYVRSGESKGVGSVTIGDKIAIVIILPISLLSKD